ncbi:RecF/RecN/SMC [Zopfochytrium polystomum]|nr:RecF/RecN/SMC [Zopfochytrium polystomum]
MDLRTGLTIVQQGKLVQLEVEDFKSYKGFQLIGPFHNFTSVIGPNGSGKSNLMDAISFVLGIQSAQLRSSKLKDLIYRSEGSGPVESAASRSRSKGKGKATEEYEEEEDEGSTENPARARVTAVYLDSTNKEVRFSRIVTSSGSSEYRINDKVVTAARYSQSLEAENILIKARNFLVFQVQK